MMRVEQEHGFAKTFYGYVSAAEGGDTALVNEQLKPMRLT